MPRYFFDVHDGVDLRDEIGRDLESGSILRAEALKVVTALMAAEADDARETTLVLTVRDAAGVTPLKVRLVCQVEEL
ncbi:DUF6894 family protein [Methylobacterium brachythecii]|uniref:DUF6894 domain-containing protein n=1 Tax=Methylobacterium brachythecii TaxID=1176177 RepID=A0A7W6AJM5_9HYPH|nr:hypothetical protein [Methylobacterium brachythecii]MBB3902071.1 hypothetical protein [Methylobacterium brachythecii]GLS44468.1 hypothetical protein GCM10007884_24560 [Methylobacterium brachythecii]